MQYDTPFRRVWRLLTPIIIYNVIIMIASLIGSMIVSAQILSTSTATDEYMLMEELFMKSMEVSVPVTCISGLITIPILWRMMRADARLRPQKADLTALKKWKFIYCVIAGILGCIAGSILVTISQIGQFSQGYAEVSETIFSQKVAIQLIAIGMVAPFVEEFIYRGVIYRRLRDYTTMKMALLISSALFGLSHGNIVQALYGFAMGLLMAYVYERYQTLWAPVICHVSANVISIIFQLASVKIASVYVAAVIALICLAGVYFILRQIYISVSVPMVNNPDFIDVTAGMENHSGFNNMTDENIYTRNDETQTRPRYSVDDYYPKNHEEDEQNQED